MPTDIVMDAGTYKTTLYSDGKIMLEQPSAVCVDTDTWEPVCFGDKAKEMFGRTGDMYTTVFPVERGVVSDYDLMEKMVVHFIKTAFGSKIVKPRVIVIAPSGVTTVQHHSLANAVAAAGCRNISTVENTVAAAVGLGIDLTKAHGSMIVDIGGGTSEVAVISLGGIVVSKSVRCAGDACDAAIINYIKKRYNLLIGERTAESIKIQIGTAYPIDRNETMQIKGRNLMSGLPENVNITSDEVREALAEPLSRIVDAVRWTLEQTPPELAADIIDHGITLTGGGALLRGLDQLIHKETGMPVFIAEYPLDCVVEGTGKILENMDKYRDTLMDESRFA